MFKKGNATVDQELVRWGCLAPELATWEDYEVVHARFLEAIAWGQAPARERGGGGKCHTRYFDEHNGGDNRRGTGEGIKCKGAIRKRKRTL